MCTVPFFMKLSPSPALRTAPYLCLGLLPNWPKYSISAVPQGRLSHSLHESLWATRACPGISWSDSSSLSATQFKPETNFLCGYLTAAAGCPRVDCVGMVCAQKTLLAPEKTPSRGWLYKIHVWEFQKGFTAGRRKDSQSQHAGR